MDGYLVEVEVDTIYGQPSISIVGLGDLAIKESNERLQSALTNSKFDFPKMKVVINLAPSDMKKSGSHFDLAMAARNAGIKNLVVPKGNVQEALLVKDMNVYGFDTLTEVTAFLQGETPYIEETLQLSPEQEISSLVDFPKFKDRMQSLNILW